MFAFFWWFLSIQGPSPVLKSARPWRPPGKRRAIWRALVLLGGQSDQAFTIDVDLSQTQPGDFLPEKGENQPFYGGIYTGV